MKSVFACARYCVLSALALLVGCAPTPIKTPAADQPQLISGNVRGQRVCGPFTNDFGNFNFVCDPLPTKVGTGWLLTPLRYPHPTEPNSRVLNTGIVFTVTTPSITSLEVAVRAAGGRRILLPQIAPGLGTPRPVGDSGQAEVSASDDGNRKTWTIAMRMPTCAQKREIEVVNIDGDGGRSNPLIIHLLRGAAEEERLCVITPPTAPPGNPPIGFETSESFEPVPTPPQAPCPGNRQRTMFMVCKACGSSPIDKSWFGIEACSFTEVKQITGFDPVNATNRSCTLTQSSSAACIGR